MLKYTIKPQKFIESITGPGIGRQMSGQNTDRVQEQIQVHMINESLQVSEKKKMDCSTNIAETTGWAFGKKYRAVSIPHLKINSRWIKYLSKILKVN